MTYIDNEYISVDWMYKWPDFYEDVTRYQRDGKNAHDDAEDALTGVVECMNASGPTARVNRDDGIKGGF